MDSVRDLVAAGGVYVVLAQYRDRFACEPAYHYLLKKEFEEYGTKMRALNDRGDDSPEGELTDGILDQLAKYERAKVAERSRRGTLRKAREGKIIATMKPPYGFRYNQARDGLIVYEPEMLVVEKIFRLAAEGLGTKAIQTRLYREGVSSPTGKELWHRPVLKRMVLNDIYKPHTYEETVELVPKEVTAALNPNRDYGIRWWNRSSQKMRQISEPGEDGRRRYRQKASYTSRDREEWIAVPVPAFLPRELVEKASTTMAELRPYKRQNLMRGWELRGVMRCGCGAAMTTHTASRASGNRTRYHYYKCHRSVDYRRNSCKQRLIRAEAVEKVVWEFVSGLLRGPEKVRAGIEALTDEEQQATRSRDPRKEAEVWVEKLEECDCLRRAYQDQQAAGLMTLEELRERLEELENTRRLAQAELEVIADREDRVKELEGDRDALLDHMAAMVPDALENLTPEERNELHRMLRLQVTPASEGYRVSGAFCTTEPLQA